MRDMSEKYIYIIGIALCMVTLVLTSCSSDSTDNAEDSHAKQRVLHLIAGRQTYSDMTVNTRQPFSVGTGGDAVNYDVLTTPESSLRVYITTSGRLDFYGDFAYEKAEGSDTYSWTKTVPLDNDNYYIYGFMPSSLMSTTTIEPYSGNNYANGAILTIGNAPSLMTDDFSAIVGVKRAPSKAGNIASAEMQRGIYEYEVTRADADNYIYLLLDHVYANLRFTMAVDETYAQLRSIHLKQFTITPTTPKFNVKATLIPGTATTLTPVFTPTGTGTGTTQTLWEGSKDMDIALNKTTDAAPTLLYGTADYQNFYIAPSESNAEFTITCRYDVCDRNGNLIRKDCEASNKLSFSGLSLKPGDRLTVPLIVMPTYLYVLSEPDLDSPAIKVN